MYGAYHVLVLAPDGTAAAQVTVVDRDVSDVQLVLQRGDVTTAQVTDVDGKPVPGVHAQRWWPPPSPRRARHVDWDISDQQGAVRLLPPAELAVARTHDAQARPVMAFFHYDQLTLFARGGGPSRQFDIGPQTVILRRPAMVTGLVVDQQGAPWSGARVSIASPEGKAVTASGSHEVGPNGRFSFIEVYPGPVRVRAWTARGNRHRAEQSLVLGDGEQRHDVRLVIPR